MATSVGQVRGAVAAAVAAGVLLAGCTEDERPAPSAAPTSRAPTPTVAPTEAPTPTTPAPPSSPTPSPRADPDDVRVGTAMAAVRHLAGTIGPRPGTSPAYFRAAQWVESELTRL